MRGDGTLTTSATPVTVPLDVGESFCAARDHPSNVHLGARTSGGSWLQAAFGFEERARIGDSHVTSD